MKPYRHPRTGPFGLTDFPQGNGRHEHDSPNDVFCYHRRHLPALKRKRCLNRRYWRFFKRTRLRARAKQVAKQLLQKSTLSKRELMCKATKHKIRYQCKTWFKSNAPVKNTLSIVLRNLEGKSFQLWFLYIANKKSCKLAKLRYEGSTMLVPNQVDFVEKHPPERHLLSTKWLYQMLSTRDPTLYKTKSKCNLVLLGRTSLKSLYPTKRPLDKSDRVYKMNGVETVML